MGRRTFTPLGDDPRNPQAAQPWKRAVAHPDELPPDYFAIISLLCGVVGLMFKVRPLRACCGAAALRTSLIAPNSPRTVQNLCVAVAVLLPRVRRQHEDRGHGRQADHHVVHVRQRARGAARRWCLCMADEFACAGSRPWASSWCTCQQSKEWHDLAVTGARACGPGGAPSSKSQPRRTLWQRWARAGQGQEGSGGRLGVAEVCVREP